MIDTSILLDPIRIGTMQLRNRIVMAPMENSFGTPDGRPTVRTIDYFEARARGGVALITLGASAIDARHKEVPSSLHFADDTVLGDHRALTEAVHAHGAKIQPQLAHAGPDGLGPEMHQVEAQGREKTQALEFTGQPLARLDPVQNAGEPHVVCVIGHGVSGNFKGGYHWYAIVEECAERAR